MLCVTKRRDGEEGISKQAIEQETTEGTHTQKCSDLCIASLVMIT